MKKKRSFSIRLLSLIIIVLLFLFSTVLSFLDANHNQQARVRHHKETNVINKPYDDMIMDDNAVKNSFTTHLPIVIIDTNGQAPKADSVWDEEKGYRVPVDYNPYVNGTLSIIDNENNLNNILDHPTIQSDILIRLRGNSSLDFDKKQYLIKIINQNGSKNEKDILGMGENWEWVLNISFIDKSLLRNYMCLNIAGEIMPYTPDVRFCEVIMKNGSENKYLGVYLMMENIKRGNDRVNIAKYDRHFENTAYILRRDRFDETGIMLNNYGTANKITEGFLDIKYPLKEEITDKTIQYIENDISNFEKAIFSEDPNEFYNYTKYIDKQAFIDYFIINEFFANYDAGYNSTYMYKENDGKLMMGPVWDFDHAIDNIYQTKINLNTIAIHAAPWYNQLLKDEDFVTELIARYHELRKTVLSEENIIDYIDTTVEFLGPAQKRDWKTWEYFYTSDYLNDFTDEKGNTINRNTKTYDEEILKIKTVLIEHGKWLDENIDSLYQFSKYSSEEKEKGLFEKFNEIIFGKSQDAWFSSIWAVLFLVIFIISIILVQRE